MDWMYAYHIKQGVVTPFNCSCNKLNKLALWFVIWHFWMAYPEEKEKHGLIFIFTFLFLQLACFEYFVYGA